MRKPLRPINIIINLILFVFTAALWVAFAPLKIGGQASYVMVHGISMEPDFIQGDLVIVTTSPDYEVGDIITYFNTQMNAHVIHRVIAIEQGRFILKGDNNSWIDTYEPTQDEILGKLWIHAPKLGIAMEWLRLPLNMALIAGIFGGVIMIGPNAKTNQKGKKKNKPSEGSSTGWVEMALYTLGFLALVFFLLSIFAFTRPVTRTADDLEYEQTGIYYYSANSPAGIFDTEIIHSGEPIFTKLTCSIIIGYSYNITGPLLQDVTGTQQLSAKVLDPQSGWSRTISITPATAFNGTSYSTTATVDLCQFQSLVDSIGEQTGFSPRTTLTIVSKIAISAKAGGQNLFDSFESKLVFNFDEVHFFLDNASGASDPLQSSKIGTIANPGLKANTVKFLGYEINVVGMRALGIGGLSLSLLGLLILGFYVFELTRRNPEALIQIRYGPMLMEVQDLGFEKIPSIIEVSSIDDLAKLAERQNAMILHTAQNSLHSYFVQSDGATYHYGNNEGRKGHAKSTTTAKPEITKTIIQPNEVPPDLENIINEEPPQTNFLPKKITIAYNGPLPYNDQGDPELPLK